MAQRQDIRLVEAGRLALTHVSLGLDGRQPPEPRNWIAAQLITAPGVTSLFGHPGESYQAWSPAMAHPELHAPAGTPAPSGGPPDEPASATFYEVIDMGVRYRTGALAVGGPAGRVESRDGAVALALSVPAQLGGEGGPGTNPEQLFAAGYAASFLSSIELAARMSKVAIDPSSSVDAAVGVGPADEGAGYSLSVDLRANLPGVDPETARQLVFEAHQICAFSNATRGVVEVKVGLGTESSASCGL